jgi:hypothetical protein
MIVNERVEPDAHKSRVSPARSCANYTGHSASLIDWSPCKLVAESFN